MFASQPPEVTFSIHAMSSHTTLQSNGDPTVLWCITLSLFIRPLTIGPPPCYDDNTDGCGPQA
jgi:hypothetical protein